MESFPTHFYFLGAKLYRRSFKESLLSNDDQIPLPETASKDIQTKTESKLEKWLNLEQGTLGTFKKAIKGFQEEDEKPSDTITTSKIPTKKITKRRYNQSRRIKVKEEPDDCNLSEFLPSSRSIKPPIKRNNLNLQDLESVCRICLRNSRKLIKLFRKVSTEDYSPAKLLEYCTSVKLDPLDSLPNSICANCWESIKIAANLKTDILESQKIIQENLDETLNYKVVKKEDEKIFYEIDKKAAVQTADHVDGSPSKKIKLEKVWSDSDENVEDNWQDTEVPQKVFAESLRPRKCYL